jgi:hypothetical protein
MIAELCALGWLAGCALLGGGGPRVPEPDRRPENARRLLDASTRREAYRRLFPDSADLHVGKGWLRLGGKGIAGERRPAFSYYATDGRNLRLLACRGDEPLLDAVERAGWLTVILHRLGECYQGPLSGEGSPLARALGWDPADLYPALTIGRTLASLDVESDPGAKTAAKTIPLRPVAGTATADGLQWVQLDEQSGLPASACWRRDGRTWVAVYRSWDRFATDEPGDAAHDARLMPQRIDLRREGSNVSLTLEIARYRFGRPVAEGMFTPVTPYPLVRRPLAALEEVLR